MNHDTLPLTWRRLRDILNSDCVSETQLNDTVVISTDPETYMVVEDFLFSSTDAKNPAIIDNDIYEEFSGHLEYAADLLGPIIINQDWENEIGRLFLITINEREED